MYLTYEGMDPDITQNVIVVAGRHGASLSELEWPTADVAVAGRPLTDAWAPVEYLQARLFFEGIRWN